MKKMSMKIVFLISLVAPGDDANKDDDLSSGDYKEKDWY